MYLLERMELIFPLKEAHFYLCSLRVRQLVAHRVGYRSDWSIARLKYAGIPDS